MLVHIFTHLDVHNTFMYNFVLAFCSVLLSFFRCKSISILSENIFGTVYCNTASNQKLESHSLVPFYTNLADKADFDA